MRQLKLAMKYSGDFSKTQILVNNFQECSNLHIQIAWLSAFKPSWLLRLCRQPRAATNKKSISFEIPDNSQKSPLLRNFIQAYQWTANLIHSLKDALNVMCYKIIIQRYHGFFWYVYFRKIIEYILSLLAEYLYLILFSSNCWQVVIEWLYKFQEGCSSRTHSSVFWNFSEQPSCIQHLVNQTLGLKLSHYQFFRKMFLDFLLRYFWDEIEI